MDGANQFIKPMPDKEVLQLGERRPAVALHLIAICDQHDIALVPPATRVCWQSPKVLLDKLQELRQTLVGTILVQRRQPASQRINRCGIDLPRTRHTVFRPYDNRYRFSIPVMFVTSARSLRRRTA
jgi:hypothetical protein